MTAPRWLSRRLVLYLHERQIVRFGGAAGIRDDGLLESALARPLNLHAYGEPDRAALAGAYAAGLVQNHPFVDGNKRTGFVAAALFMELNGCSLEAPEAEAVVMTLGLAAGEIDEDGYAAWLRDRSRAV